MGILLPSKIMASPDTATATRAMRDKAKEIKTRKAVSGQRPNFSSVLHFQWPHGGTPILHFTKQMLLFINVVSLLLNKGQCMVKISRSKHTHNVNNE